MGDRGQVKVIQQPDAPAIWLYTHWGASELSTTVQTAIARKERWSDPEYLTRIIFCEMVKGQEGGSTGYGIGIARHGDVWQVVTVDIPNQTISVSSPEIGPVSFEAFAEGGLRLLAEGAARAESGAQWGE